MTNPLIFDDLQEILHRHIDPLPDYRKKGPNTRYRIQDGALGAFGIFLTQSPSFLDYQRTVQQTRGHNNAHTLAEHEGHHWNGRFTAVTMVRDINDVLLRSGDDTLSVNWFEITVVNAKTGEQLYHNSCITNHRLTADNVVAVAQSGRGRWKIENENNNVLKTKGYHPEHNFGHGKQYLAAFMLSLNLLAFLFHTVLEWSDDRYALLRRVLARRQTFFNDIQALMRYMVFDHWDHLMDFMIRGLELESQVDSS